MDKALFTISRGFAALQTWSADNKPQYIARELPTLKNAYTQLQAVYSDMMTIKAQASADESERKKLKRQLYQAACEEEVLIKASKQY